MGPQRFHIVVSNQSFAVDPVDITITVDGKEMVRGKFIVGGQHIHKTFDFTLAPGDHVLEAHSKKGAATKRYPFTLSKEHWVTVMYWYYPPGSKGGVTPTPRSFSIDASDTMPMFD